MIYMAIVGAGSLIGGYVSNTLKSKFAKYQQVGIRSGLTGKEVAEDMLKYYNIHEEHYQKIYSITLRNYDFS